MDQPAQYMTPGAETLGLTGAVFDQNPSEFAQRKRHPSPDRRPTALVIRPAHLPAAMGIDAACIELAGFRMLGQCTSRDAPDRLRRIAATDLILIDLGSSGCIDAMDEFAVRAVQATVAALSARLIVRCSLATLDHADAIIGIGHATFLCDATSSDLAAALVAAAQMQRGAGDRVQEPDTDRSDVMTLMALGEEVRRLAAAIDALSGRTRAGLSDGAPAGSIRSDENALLAANAIAKRDARDPFRTTSTNERQRRPVSAADVRALLRLRRARSQLFPGDLFADPAWDMLLDLTAAHLSGDRVSVSSLCIAAAVPATTALRWIGTLSDRGLIVREEDPADKRRVFVRLQDDAAQRMIGWMESARASGLWRD